MLPPTEQAFYDRNEHSSVLRQVVGVRIALLEDDPAQAETLVAWLSDAGHDAHVFGLGKDLLRSVGRESFDTFLIDWMLPDLSGHEVLRQLREDRGVTAPAIFVTSRDAEEDIVAGLDAGADDYMIKPIRRLELLSRLDAVWRRVHPREEGQHTIDLPPYRFELDHRRVLRNGQPVEPLTEKEFVLAVFLFQNLGRLFSRGHLLQAIWGLTQPVPTRTLDTHISRVRKKLDLHPANGFRLVPAYNYGYRLERVGEPEAS
jgi:two-component system, OmpR family, response regulator RegX3